MVRELTKSEQARGALVGTPGSTHARHSTKEPKQYGPGFFGGKGWARLFWLGTIVVMALFVGFIVYEETQHAEHAEETGHEDPGTPTPGTDDAGESRDTSGTALGPADTTVLPVAAL